MIYSSNINFINSEQVSSFNIKKNTNDTNKTTGFDSYLATQVSSTKSDETPNVHENTTKENSVSGQRYLTVQIGQKVYTYMVIGEIFQILIGIDDANEEEEVDEENEKTANGKAVDDTKDINGSGDKQSKVQNQMAEPDFMMDTRMFALTGYYQKKMREVMKEMQENLGDGKLANAKEGLDTEEKKMKQ